MALFEINPKYLQFKSDTEIYRFIHDLENRVSIHIWQNKSDSNQSPEHDKNISENGEIAINRFQVAMDNSILEWKNGHINFGEVDSGDDVFGMKKSPVMLMSDQVDNEFIKKIVPVLKENENIAGIKFLIQIIEGSAKS